MIISRRFGHFLEKTVFLLNKFTVAPANMQDRANVGHQLAGLAKRRQICQRFANVANVLPTSLQTA